MNRVKTWPSLDVLRGLAVIFMLLNHAAVKLLSEETIASGLTGWLFFIGSFAPVLFFFATGLGYGLAHEPGKPANTKNLLIKALILIMADIFMRGGDFTLIGWDFLAFIGFSMIFLHGFRGRKYGLSAAILCIFALLFLRFFLGALYNKILPEEEQIYWLTIVLGLKTLPHVSYWFTPWLVYPLIGFVLGALTRKHVHFTTINIGKISLILMVLGLIIAVGSFLLWSKGAIIFRWGTVSLNFFIASVACMLLSLATSSLIADKFKSLWLTKALSMQGVSSLAVVPIHYFYLAIFVLVVPEKLSSTDYLFALPAWLIICFISARMTNYLIVWLAKSSHKNKALMPVFVVMVISLAIVSTLSVQFWWVFMFTFVAQYVLCILLGFSYSKR